MKAISLWQPWAQLCVIPDPADPGVPVKGFETRSWRTWMRGRVLIHAGRRYDLEQRAYVGINDFKWPLQAAGFHERNLPLGAFVGTVEIVGCHPAASIRLAREHERFLVYGNYQNGRYAWELRNPIMFDTPVPFSGHQGFFEVPPDAIDPIILAS